jgi:glycosyltransferase involved in cell wall biosynthesis
VGGISQCLVLEFLKSFGQETAALHEIIVVADAHTPQGVINALSALPKVVLEHFSEPFNFSKKCNVGARHSSGDVILFLNDDMLAQSTGWVGQIQAQFADPLVGGVGGLLLTPEGLVHCAGLKTDVLLTSVRHMCVCVLHVCVCVCSKCVCAQVCESYIGKPIGTRAVPQFTTGRGGK